MLGRYAITFCLMLGALVCPLHCLHEAAVMAAAITSTSQTQANSHKLESGAPASDESGCMCRGAIFSAPAQWVDDSAALAVDAASVNAPAARSVCDAAGTSFFDHDAWSDHAARGIPRAGRALRALLASFLI